ncbi:hypothetical protein HPB50_024922 [Hyalomma asiaticum]|uniref:Uncharacterized protein n=1 Tax=Hyalomma asiaticum TaxID=266040 RepID=A0ACB7SSF7_HYAAI|nr:hypothetical protein HPB50_024922 [Hyalomma asiaticum]
MMMRGRDTEKQVAEGHVRRPVRRRSVVAVPLRNHTGPHTDSRQRRSGRLAKKGHTQHSRTITADERSTQSYLDDGHRRRHHHTDSADHTGGRDRRTGRQLASPDFPLTCPELGGTKVRAARRAARKRVGRLRDESGTEGRRPESTVT